MPADVGGKCGHYGVVEVQRAAVCWVRVQRAQGCLPQLGRHQTETEGTSLELETLAIFEAFQRTFCPLAKLLFGHF